MTTKAPQISYPFNGQIRTNEYGYGKLMEFYQWCEGREKQHILLDFTAVGWFDANLTVLLQAMVYKLNRAHGHVFYINPTFMREQFPVLFRNGFLSSIEKVQDEFGKAVQLKTFRSDEDEKFLMYIQNDLIKTDLREIDGKNKKQLADHFLEVFSNIQLHANTTDSVFACGQFYPKQKELKFTLIDLGEGFLPKIKVFTKGEVDTSAKAIKWAVNGGSTKANTPGGIGLSGIMKWCEDNDAGLEIVTGDAYLSHAFGRSRTLTVSPFCGTIVNILFRCHGQDE
jgi:hypothetical protein